MTGERLLININKLSRVFILPSCEVAVDFSLTTLFLRRRPFIRELFLKQEKVVKEDLPPYAGVAQLVEQLICNQQVGGSSPSTS